VRPYAASLDDQEQDQGAQQACPSRNRESDSPARDAQERGHGAEPSAVRCQTIVVRSAWSPVSAPSAIASATGKVDDGENQGRNACQREDGRDQPRNGGAWKPLTEPHHPLVALPLGVGPASEQSRRADQELTEGMPDQVESRDELHRTTATPAAIIASAVRTQARNVRSLASMKR